MAGDWDPVPRLAGVLGAAFALGTVCVEDLLLLRRAHGCHAQRRTADDTGADRHRRWDRLRLRVPGWLVWGRTGAVLRAVAAFAWLARRRDEHAPGPWPRPSAVRARREPDGRLVLGVDGPPPVGATAAPGPWRLVGPPDPAGLLAVWPVLSAETGGACRPPCTALALGQ